MLAILDFIFHGSVRKIARKLSLFFESVSKSSLHEWIRSFTNKIKISCKKKHRDVIAIDETVIKHQGKKFFLWGAIDAFSKELLAIHVSQYGDSIETYRLLKEAMKYCSNKPLVLRDGASWYNYAFQWTGLENKHVTFGRRNPIERFFGYVKDRSKIFYNNINTPNIKRGLYSIWLFGNMIGFYYKYLR
ncbi:MAG: DDE-type integrase/transposase/recombinase [Candidatus Aenigmatarchaeota archaeon]